MQLFTLWTGQGDSLANVIALLHRSGYDVFGERPECAPLDWWNIKGSVIMQKRFSYDIYIYI